MEVILIVLISLCLVIFILFAWWFLLTILSDEPEDATVGYTKEDKKIIWNVNRPPFLYNRPVLAYFVSVSPVFYWVGSVFGGALVYVKTKSFLYAILSTAGFLIIGREVLKPIIIALVRSRVREYKKKQKRNIV